MGDYCSGPNHMLPTYGYARAYSGLSLEDFQKRITVQELTPAGLRGLGRHGADAGARSKDWMRMPRRSNIRLAALAERSRMNPVLALARPEILDLEALCACGLAARR